MAIKLDLKDSKLLGFKSEYKQFNKAKNVSFIENYLESFENIPELFPKA